MKKPMKTEPKEKTKDQPMDQDQKPVSIDEQSNENKPKRYRYISILPSGDKEYPFTVKYNTWYKKYETFEEAKAEVKLRISKNKFLIYKGIWDLDDQTLM